MIEACQPAPTQVYAVTVVFMAAIACVIAFGAGAGVVFWRMTGRRG